MWKLQFHHRIMFMLEVILLGTCLLLGGSMRVSANDGFTDCPVGFDYNDELNLCYKALFEDLLWDQATVKCDSLTPGGRLAVILTQSQQNIVAKFLSDKIEEKPEGVRCNDKDDQYGGLHFWIAGRTKELTEPYFWRLPNGLEIPLSYTSWNTGSPVTEKVNGMKYLCAVANSSVGYKWTTTRCGLPRCALCEV